MLDSRTIVVVLGAWLLTGCPQAAPASDAVNTAEVADVLTGSDAGDAKDSNPANDALDANGANDANDATDVDEKADTPSDQPTPDGASTDSVDVTMDGGADPDANDAVDSTDGTDTPSDQPTPDGASTDSADAMTDSVDVTTDSGADAGPGPALGTFGNPILAGPLPFVDTRDTSVAPGPVFDTYECALETDEGGDGFVYRVDVTQAGVLEVAVNDIPADGIDVDVHLLTAANPGSCLIRDNIAFTFGVEPGAYFVVVDTWTNSSQVALAGPYTLTVAFTSDTSGDAPYGATGNPIIVDSFPFSDSRDTELAPSDVFDTYSCEPTVDESGGEFVYQVTVPSAGQLTAVVNDVAGDGVDIDVHLMSELDAATCLARDNLGWTEYLQPGVYYVVADTFVNSAGVALSGAYAVDIDFVPDTPAAIGYGSLQDPILIDAFPFYDVRDTTQGPSDVFDSYSCAPSANESGKEFVYLVDVQEAGILQASLVDTVGDGIDVDIQLLSGTTSDTCIARGDRSLAATVTPGTYILTADTFVSSSGQPMAGPYELHVQLVPEPDLSSFCLVLYGDTRGNSSADPQLAHQKVASAINARCATTTLVHTGDHVRSGSSDSDWATFVAIEKTIYDNEGILFSARGNHDGSWSNMQNRLAPLGVTLPAQSSYTAPLATNLTLMVLDTEADAAAQVPFIQATFAANPGHRFLIAFHRPLYPSVGGHSGWGPGQTDWMPEFVGQAGKVVVATGHNHGMSREVVDGVTLVTAGGGGAPLYGCGKAHDDTRYCDSTYGYMVCDATLNCVAYAVDAETGAERLVDAFIVD